MEAGEVWKRAARTEGRRDREGRYLLIGQWEAAGETANKHCLKKKNCNSLVTRTTKKLTEKKVFHILMNPLRITMKEDTSLALSKSLTTIHQCDMNEAE